MSGDERYDVLIVGAGPVGSAAANIAAAHGLRALLVDEAEEVFPLPRAIHFDADIMRILQFAGLADRIEPITRATTGGVHLGCDGQPIREFRVPDVPGDLGWRPHYMFFQPQFDAALREAAAGRPTVDSLFGWRYERLLENADQVGIVLANPTGTRREVHGRYLIAADGAASTLRRQLSLELRDYGFDEPWVIVDAEVGDESSGPDHTIMYCDPARPATYVPGPGRHRRWEFMLLPGESAEWVGAPTAAEEMVRAITPWLDNRFQVLRVAVYRFHALVARDWRAGNVFLVGDAAHQTPPFYGQGMCHGIRDVRNLLWKVAAVLEGRAAGGLLDTYQREREPHVRAIIEAAVENGRYICTLDREVALRRDRELRERMGQGRDVRSFREVIPGLRSGLLDPLDAEEPVGLLFPQPDIATQTGRVKLDELLGTGFALVSTVAIDDSLEAAQFAEARGGTILVIEDADVDIDGTIAAWFATFGCTAAIVRPDRYVFGVAREREEIGDLLGRLNLALDEPSAVGSAA
jgi:3-(3-hydroxy-phenyl)propionate hydroxylase